MSTVRSIICALRQIWNYHKMSGERYLEWAYWMLVTLYICIRCIIVISRPVVNLSRQLIWLDGYVVRHHVQLHQSRYPMLWDRHLKSKSSELAGRYWHRNLFTDDDDHRPEFWRISVVQREGSRKLLESNIRDSPRLTHYSWQIVWCNLGVTFWTSFAFF